MSPEMERCHWCPLAGTDKACLPLVSRHRRLCELLDPAHPKHHPGYRAIAAQKHEQAEAIEAERRASKTATTRTKFARMKRCPHWEKATDCGCGINRCALGRGDRGRVAHSDCFKCPDLPAADH